MSRTTTRLVTIAAIALLCVTGAYTPLPVAERAPAERPVYRLASLEPWAPPPGVVDAVVDAPQAPQTPAAATTLRRSPSEALTDARRFSAAFAEVAEAATPAVVQVRTERSLGPRAMERVFEGLPDGHPVPDFPQVADGTGFLVSGDGLILTNNHVIAGADRIRVTLRDKRVFDARVVGTDPTTDLALIVVDEGGLPYVRLGDSEALRVGEWVIAIGNPGFRDDNTLDFTVTSGIVSAKGRPLRVIQDDLAGAGDPAARYAIEDFIQTDAAINPGNSGGPLLDLNGAVVGVNTAIASVNGVNQGYGFAVPINVARRVMRDLLKYGHVRRPLLGISIQEISPEDAQVYGLPRIAGVLVEDFADDSPARRADLRRHDVIVGLDGVAVERLGQFQGLVAAHEPGETVEVDVIRYGERLRIPVKLTEADLGRREVVRTEPDRPAPGLGVELVDLTRSLARERRFREAGGALIAAVAPGSVADRKGVPQGVVIREINQRAVRTAAEAEEMFGALTPGSIASLLLEYPQGGTLIRNVRIP